jgi:glutamine cyclotransferase
MSDGSATLQFRNPETFAVTRTVGVRDPRSGPVDKLNELEYVDGKVFANIYGARRIAIIEPRSGAVEGYVMLDGRELASGQRPTLLPQPQWNALDARWDVLNGIAYDSQSKHLFITGKRWPVIFEVTLRKVADRL